MGASAQVRKAIEAGYSPLADGLAAAATMRFTVRPRDPGPYHNITVYAGHRHIEVTVSPTGRSVQVHVDGKEIA